jgi:enoyl-CoA hydratase
MKLVRSDRDDGTAVITLADARRRNAISLPVADQFTEVLAAAQADPAVRAIVITGEGTAFCAGADRDALRQADETTLRRIYEVFARVRDCPLPTVAAVNGPAVGAGFNLALACDVRFAGHSAVFDSRFLSIPIHPGGGHTWMLAQAVGPQASAAMTLFGAALGGARAAEIGLAWRCVPDAELVQASVEFCRTVAAAPARLVCEIKETLRAAPGLDGHGAATEYELGRQVASIGRPEYLERFGGSR